MKEDWRSRTYRDWFTYPMPNRFHLCVINLWTTCICSVVLCRLWTQVLFRIRRLCIQGMQGLLAVLYTLRTLKLCYRVCASLGIMRRTEVPYTLLKDLSWMLSRVVSQTTSLDSQVVSWPSTRPSSQTTHRQDLSWEVQQPLIQH